MANEYDVNEVWRLVERVARSEAKDVTDDEQAALRWLRNVVGSRRELTSYAPRTRSRYRKASREGKTATQINVEEGQRRRAKSGSKGSSRGPSRSTRMRQLIAKRNTFFPHEPVDIDDVQDYVQAFGYDNVIHILEEQIDSCENFLRGDSRPGRSRWFSRRYENVRPNFSEYISNTDVFYYYHARRN